jgi:hypothetical protein
MSSSLMLMEHQKRVLGQMIVLKHSAVQQRPSAKLAVTLMIVVSQQLVTASKG